MNIEKLIAEMEVQKDDHRNNEIGIYFKVRSDRIEGFGYTLFASLVCVPEVDPWTMKEIFPYNREDLKSFIEWALAQKDEARWEPKLVWWKKDNND